MDFAEFFTRSARDAVPLAWSRGLLFLFDYRGPVIAVDADQQALGRSLSRLSRAALDLLDEGAIFVTAQTQWSEGGLADVTISISGSGRRAGDHRVSNALAQLDLTERAPAAGAPEGSRVAHGVCPDTGAPISFGADRDEGILFAVDLTVPARLQPAEPAPHAEGACAWLLSHRPDASRSLALRLQRLGWHTQHFVSPHSAGDRLRGLPADAAPPVLVLGIASSELQAGDLQSLRRLLPPQVPIILGTVSDAPAADGVECRPWPFSPAELFDITRRVHEARRQRAEPTRPASPRQPRALVVDDNEVNRLVGGGLLGLLGFDVHTAVNGEEAIARCMARAPQLVLMDLNMPGMDGMQATRRLRQLQGDGTLAHFVVLAATADVQPAVRSACHAAGMDGVLAKPLDLQALERQVDRLLPGLRGSGLAH